MEEPKVSLQSIEDSIEKLTAKQGKVEECKCKPGVNKVDDLVPKQKLDRSVHLQAPSVDSDDDGVGNGEDGVPAPAQLRGTQTAEAHGHIA